MFGRFLEKVTDTISRYGPVEILGAAVRVSGKRQGGGAPAGESWGRKNNNFMIF